MTGIIVDVREEDGLGELRFDVFPNRELVSFGSK